MSTCNRPSRSLIVMRAVVCVDVIVSKPSCTPLVRTQARSGAVRSMISMGRVVAIVIVWCNVGMRAGPGSGEWATAVILARGADLSQEAKAAARCADMEEVGHARKMYGCSDILE